MSLIKQFARIFALMSLVALLSQPAHAQFSLDQTSSIDLDNALNEIMPLLEEREHPFHKNGFEKTKQLALDGNAAANYLVGLAYTTDKPVATDKNKAIQFFEIASNSGIPSADYQLGLIYIKKPKEERSTETVNLSKIHLTKAAEAGHALAQYLLSKQLGGLNPQAQH